MKPDDINVQGMVVQPDGQPYVRIVLGELEIGQFTVAEARSIAEELIMCASAVEDEAMIYKRGLHGQQRHSSRSPESAQDGPVQLSECDEESQAE